MPDHHQHTYQRADLTADTVPCDTCGQPAPPRTVRRLRRQLAALKAANGALARVLRTRR